MTVRVRGRIERFPLRRPFAISRGAKTEAVVLVVELDDGQFVGSGHSVPYPRYGENAAGCLRLLDTLSFAAPAQTIEGLSRGALRSALGSALLALEAKRDSRRAYEVLGVPPPEPLPIASTITVAPPKAMAEDAARATSTTLKLKVGGDAKDLERVRAVREASPDATILIDANEGWDLSLYRSLLPELVELGVALIEQPFPSDRDEALRDLPRPIPICADESLVGAVTPDDLADRYDAVNIKLEKAGGVREALAQMEAATELGLRTMLGCMVGSSLSVAPAILLGGLADWVDLDGACFLDGEPSPRLRYAEGRVWPLEGTVWGTRKSLHGSR
ncbi:MAG: dipeptide epimerase [Myxococcota bacterium]